MIPKDRWGVHETHCCIIDGCKYGDKDCPVVLGLIRQKYFCESCRDDYYYISYGSQEYFDMEDKVWLKIDKKIKKVKNETRIKKLNRILK